MKKLFSIIGAASLITTSASYIVSCSTTDKFQIIFVPSNNSTEIIKTVKPLENLLEAQLQTLAKARGTTFTQEVEVIVSTSYETAGKTLSQGKADVGLLPIGTYQEYRGTSNTDGTYSDLGWLLSASRSAVKPETTYASFLDNGTFSSSQAAATHFNNTESLGLAKHYNESISNLNNESTAEQIDNALLDSSTPASYYRSYIYANNSFLKEQQFDLSTFTSPVAYQQALKQIILSSDTNFALSKSTTSGAGTLYPLLWLRDVVGLTDSEIIQVYKNRKTQNDYPDAASKLSSNAVDIAVGFSDIRNELSELSDKTTALANTTIIGASSSIVNDGIQYSKKALNGDTALINDLRQAFINLINDSANAEIFNIYNHKGYIGPNAYDDATVSKYEIDSDASITAANAAVSEMAKLIKDVV